MTILRARVKGCRIIVEAPTELPEGTEVTLVLLDAQDVLTDADRVELEAAIERGRVDIAAGRGVSAEDLVAQADGEVSLISAPADHALLFAAAAAAATLRRWGSWDESPTIAVTIATPAESRFVLDPVHSTGSWSVRQAE